jgi:hypothetical protein
MVLERGHAPISVTDTDTYLANPIANSKYLLAPDVDFGGEQITRHSNFIPFGNAKKYLCFATTVAPWNIKNIGAVTHPSESSFTPPTYYNESFRSGYQYGVNGYGFGNGSNYNGLRSFGDNVSGNRINNNVSVYAILASDRNAFLTDVKAICPNFLRMIVACFVVDKEMIKLGNSHTIANHTIYEVSGNEYDIGGFNIDKSMFGYPAKYQKYAKLYTYPYATMEISDNNGKSVDVRIENTGDIRAHVIASVAFPYLNLRCFFNGINGIGSNTYAWVRLDGSTANRNIPQGDWFKYCFDMDIPTYAIYMDGETSFMLDGYSSALDNARRQALVSYHNNVRSANTSAENAIDSSNVAHTNVYANANTSVTNNDNDCNTRRANADIVIATNTANTEADNATATSINSRTQNKNSAITGYTNAASALTTRVENHVTVLATKNGNNAQIQSSQISSASSGATSGLVSGAGMGATIGATAGSVAPGIGTAIGAAAGVVVGGAIGFVTATSSSGINAAAATENAMLATNASETVQTNTNTLNTMSKEEENDASGDIQDHINENKTAQTARNNQAFSSQTNNNIATARTNCGNNANTAKGNADRTNNNSIFCTNENRYTAIANAKNVLENTQAMALARVRDAQRKQPISVCSYGGEFAPDYNESKGIQVRVRTQNESAIAQAGDTFARYGYALNQAWNVEESGLKLMKNFTFWKADDIWIDDIGAANNNVIKILTGIFSSGVTVWNDADKIGKVSVYDN